MGGEQVKDEEVQEAVLMSHAQTYRTQLKDGGMIDKLIYISASLKCWRAYVFPKRFCKHKDVHGRTYRDVHKIHGHAAMVGDYLCWNSWIVR